MSRDTLMLEGEVVDPKAIRITVLETELRQVRRELADAQIETDRAREDASRALSMLRKQLGPLYRALQAVFGELDAAGVPDDVDQRQAAPSSQPGNARVSAVWESWKSKLGAAGKLIDALLIHGEMNTQQLAIATGLHRTTIPKHIYTLNKAGLLSKNGGRFSLKQL